MELKDVILSTLAEMEDVKPSNNHSQPIIDDLKQAINKKPVIEAENEQNSNSELHFLTSMRERLLVLFEGFQAPNNTNIEAKVDMTLNFLEYVLVTIDTRVHDLEKGRRK